jgi:hypothetical protein
LKPWRKRMWCIPPKQNARFVCEMENVLDVYRRPYDPDKPVVCMDETTKQMVKERRLPSPAQPGQTERYDYEYERAGVANIFMFTEPLKGRRKVCVTDRRTGADWAYRVRDLLEEDYAEAGLVTLVSDNLNTHDYASFYEVFEPEYARRLMKRLDLVHTPRHGSWLNIAEIELSALSRQCLSRRIADREELKREIAAWEGERNQCQVGVDWRFTTEDARIKLKRLYPLIRR